MSAKVENENEKRKKKVRILLSFSFGCFFVVLGTIVLYIRCPSPVVA